jgi:hypothetical protein
LGFLFSNEGEGCVEVFFHTSEPSGEYISIFSEGEERRKLALELLSQGENTLSIFNNVISRK